MTYGSGPKEVKKIKCIYIFLGIKFSSSFRTEKNREHATDIAKFCFHHDNVSIIINVGSNKKK